MVWYVDIFDGLLFHLVPLVAGELFGGVRATRSWFFEEDWLFGSWSGGTKSIEERGLVGMLRPQWGHRRLVFQPHSALS